MWHGCPHFSTLVTKLKIFQQMNKGKCKCPKERNTKLIKWIFHLLNRTNLEYLIILLAATLSIFWKSLRKISLKTTLQFRTFLKNRPRDPPLKDLCVLGCVEGCVAAGTAGVFAWSVVSSSTWTLEFTTFTCGVNTWVCTGISTYKKIKSRQKTK